MTQLGEKIYSILLGYSNNQLFGTKNDIYLIYNLFCSLTLSSKIFLDDSVKLDNIINYIATLDINENILLIIYFTGHANINGSLKFHNEKIDIHLFLTKINEIIRNPIKLYFIFDCCFSKNFFIKHNHFNNIIKISYLVSCSYNELSKEIDTAYHNKLFKYHIPDIHVKDRIVASVMTLYFVKIAYAKNYTIHEFKNIINDNTFKMISSVFKQTIYFNEYT